MDINVFTPPGRTRRASTFMPDLFTEPRHDPESPPTLGAGDDPATDHDDSSGHKAPKSGRDATTCDAASEPIDGVDNPVGDEIDKMIAGCSKTTEGKEKATPRVEASPKKKPAMKVAAAAMKVAKKPKTTTPVLTVRSKTVVATLLVYR